MGRIITETIYDITHVTRNAVKKNSRRTAIAMKRDGGYM